MSSLKIYISVFLSFFVLFNLSSQNTEISKIKIEDDNNKLLLFKSSSIISNNRYLWLQNNDKKELVWSNKKQKGKTVYGGNIQDIDPYIGATIIQGAIKDDILLVLFRLDSKINGLSGILPDMKDKYRLFKEEWDGNDYLLRSFIKKNDGWEVYISVFLNTVWSDAVNEKIINLNIENKNTYLVSYKGSWDIIGNISDRFADKYKLRKEEGKTIKKIYYSTNDKLLYTFNTKKQPLYIAGCCWWVKFDEFDIKNNSKYNHYFIMKNYEKQLNKLNIKPKEYMYIRKGINEKAIDSVGKEFLKNIGQYHNSYHSINSK